MAEMILTCSVCGKRVKSTPIFGAGMWHVDGTMMCVDGVVQSTGIERACAVKFMRLDDVCCARARGHFGPHEAPGIRWDHGWGEDPVPEPHWSDILTPDQKRKFTNKLDEIILEEFWNMFGTNSTLAMHAYWPGVLVNACSSTSRSNATNGCSTHRCLRVCTNTTKNNSRE